MRLIFKIESVQDEGGRIKLTLVDILTGKRHNVIISNLKRKKQVLAFRKGYSPEIEYVVGDLRKGKNGKCYLNVPYKFLRREEVEGTIYDPKVVESMIEVARRRGYYIDEEINYTDGFKAYWLQKGYLRIRVGIPTSYDGYAVWILIFVYDEKRKKWIDVTPRTNIYSKRMKQYAPRYRIFHNNKNPVGKFEEILDEIEKRFGYAIQRRKQTRIDAYLNAKLF